MIGMTMTDTRLANAIRPKLSKAARERIEGLIEAYECGEDSQEGTDIQFLLDFHDNVHAAWEDDE